jgi:hypothetical protein
MNQFLKPLFLWMLALSWVAQTAAQTAPRYLITNDDNPTGNTVTFYTIGSDNSLTQNTVVATGGDGDPRVFGTRSVIVAPVGTQTCAFVTNEATNDISAIDVATQTLAGVFKAGPKDSNQKGGIALRANSKFLYAAFAGGDTTDASFATFKLLAGCKLKYLGSLDLGNRLLTNGWMQGSIAVHDNILVTDYAPFTLFAGQIESFNLSDGLPKSNGDRQLSTSTKKGFSLPSNVEITADGKFAIFNDGNGVEVSDISSGKLTPTKLYQPSGKAPVLASTILSPDESLLLRTPELDDGTTPGEVVADFFDKNTGVVTPGCTSAPLQGGVQTFSFLGGIAFADSTQGTGGLLYVTEDVGRGFGDFSGIEFVTAVAIQSDGKKCSLTEMPNLRIVEPHTFGGMPDLASSPPRAF